ncbi:MAG: rod shape-determining protein [Candidatus Pacebacteria bacterium]|jgi:rod shape-determining protein MreB|nr:rod shape-determining protein [Candidatus Paceibacterota bacterium]MBP9700797.1 rod shape-determining protein [Candidatus Paceibacterota bacterium]
MWKLGTSKKIGIDLGTTNTLVYVAGKGVVLNEPTVVAVDRTTKTIVAIGLEAKDMIGKTPDTITVYRPMQDGAIADYNITYALLRYFLTKALGRSSLFKPDVLVSVPAGITSTERRAVIEATMKAGAKSAIIVKEAILAALGAGVSINDAKGCMIIDSGGGTTDIAVISLGGIVASTSVKCGGNKLDQAIIDYIKRTYNVIIGDQTAEEVKKTLAAALPITPDSTGSVKGRDTVAGLPVTLSITTNELVKAIDYELKLIIKAIKSVLEQTPPELASDIIDNGIVMTGGTSGLAHLPALIEQQTGIKVRVADDASYAVVKGTGILLDHLDDYKRSILVKR